MPSSTALAPMRRALVHDERMVGVTEARQRLTEILDRVLAGEEVVVTRRGTPVAAIVPVPVPPDARPLGLAAFAGAAATRRRPRRGGRERRHDACRRPGPGAAGDRIAVFCFDTDVVVAALLREPPMPLVGDSRRRRRTPSARPR